MKADITTTEAEVRQTVFDTIESLNEQLPAARRLPIAIDTPLAGPDGSLDSLGIVNLIAILEQLVEERFHVSMSVLDEDPGDGALFATAGSLTDFVLDRVRERLHA